jgi:hypothetical protein
MLAGQPDRSRQMASAVRVRSRPSAAMESPTDEIIVRPRQEIRVQFSRGLTLNPSAFTRAEELAD